MVYRLYSEEETERFARVFSRGVKAGDVICLSGELGAGKTVFTRGLARGLGYSGRVTSPTFTLMNVYEGGRLTVYHFDLYRLDGEADLEGIGCEEYFGAGGVCVLEWPERGNAFFDGGVTPYPIRRIQIKSFLNDDINYRELVIHEDIGD
ncbi:MAG: tRNA (adenosine(37)-N6)-threonylcarbamoyltransferase complex ATPase subunit type 1 TsaE [Defluviitaleaceae bacterium]|nr:tRNA (adenosine(37)-N6)-threonylcarbamoyltransferase complex ATPase subunit type 1 TsaE [Defluviitaleaceae bacterium]